MYTIPKRKGMARKKKEGPVVNFQLKLYGEEANRWLKIRAKAKERNHYIDDTSINRRLLGLDPDVDGSVTEKDRLTFQTSSAAGKQPEMLGQIAAKTRLAEVPRRKRK